MNVYVTDTHALLWYILENPRLSETAANIFQQADNDEVQIFVPTIVLVELVYLIEKVIGLIEMTPSNYRLTPIHPSTIRAMRSIPYALIPDMPDRIITATALELGFPLITKDRKIAEANVVSVIW
jgi:PIN domain nuclease of toxin-antitoxin system